MAESRCVTCIYCIPGSPVTFGCSRGITPQVDGTVVLGTTVIKCLRYHRVKYPTRFERILNEPEAEEPLQALQGLKLTSLTSNGL
jgi:hypothetical protein